MLHSDLAIADAHIAASGTVLPHLLAGGDTPLLNDEVLARVRGMLADVARQLSSDDGAPGAFDTNTPWNEGQASTRKSIEQDATVLSHAQALALEFVLAGQFERSHGIEPVLPPLLQELSASPEDELAGLARQVIAAQESFVRHTRRMQLPLSELSPELLGKAQHMWRVAAEDGQRGDGTAGHRIGLMFQLISRLEGEAVRALRAEQAGLAMFATALALASGQMRDAIVLAMSVAEPTRLMLIMRAGGLDREQIRRQLRYLCPDAAPPDRIEAIFANRATDLLQAGETA